MSNNYLYFLNSKPYINLTNNCTNSCVFCVRDIKNSVMEFDMHLVGKLCAENVISQFGKENTEKILNAGEITFCGYGEPLLEYETLMQVAKYIKKEFPTVKIRINTNGCAEVALKKDILPNLVGLIDTISISLNAHDEKTYDIVSKPHIEHAYNSMLEFAKKSVELGFETIMTIVVGFDDNIFIDTNKCENIANNIGAKFRIREYIKEGY